MEVKTLADRLAEVKATTVRDTLGHVENYSLVNKFVATLAEIKAKTIDGTLRYVQAEALVNTTADTLPEVREKNFADILSYGEDRSKWRPRYCSTCWLTR